MLSFIIAFQNGPKKKIAGTISIRKNGVDNYTINEQEIGRCSRERKNLNTQKANKYIKRFHAKYKDLAYETCGELFLDMEKYFGVPKIDINHG